MIGEKIKEIRLELGLTREQFGQKLNVSKAMVPLWEGGHFLPNDKMLKAIANLGNLTVDELQHEKDKTILKFISTKDDVQLPTRSSKGSVGYDFYIYEDVIFEPNESKLIDTHVAVNMPEDVHLQLHARSSLFSKRGFIFPNSPGIIDPDYQDSIKIPLLNANEKPVTLKAGERVAQGVFVHHLNISDNVESQREGGFGSSGN